MSQAKATLYADDAPLSVARLWPDQGPTPGHVGVAVSGGGSRALSAAMGQLRGLATLQLNGEPLLAQARALAACSGGAWCATAFVFLPEGTSDEAYFGPYVAPERLRLKAPPAPGFMRDAPVALDRLGDGCIGEAPTSPLIATQAMAVGAVRLTLGQGVAAERLWTVMIAERMLQPYGLFQPGEAAQSTTTFCLDEPAKAAILANRPDLKPSQVFPAQHGGEGRMRRPFYVVQGAVFVDTGGAHQPLVPFHVTPVWTGVPGRRDGVDANGRPIGGGGVSTPEFDSQPVGTDGGAVVVEQAQPWSLAATTGTCSSSFADALENTYRAMRDDPEAIRRLVLDYTRAVEADTGRPPLSQTGLLDRDSTPEAVLAVAERLTSLVPRHRYWSPTAPRPGEPLEPTGFADGGSLENTGIAALLTYQDVARIIAFINVSKPMGEVDLGVFTAEGDEVPDSRLYVEDQVPVLFGYQPWKAGQGYRLYAGAAHTHRPDLARSQVFESTAFAPLLRALWAAHGGRARTAPAVAEMTLNVPGNPWLGVPARSTPVTVVFSYLSRVRGFWDRLHPSVQRHLGAFEDDATFGAWPHYATTRTHLPAEQVSLAAHLTAWCVADPANADIYLRQFRPTDG